MGDADVGSGGGGEGVSIRPFLRSVLRVMKTRFWNEADAYLSAVSRMTGFVDIHDEWPSLISEGFECKRAAVEALIAATDEPQVGFIGIN